MTSGRAAAVRLVTRYQSMALEVSSAEVQQLMYFLQIAGEPLRIDFQKGDLGLSAVDHRSVLRDLLGHYVQGYACVRTPVVESGSIALLPGADEAAEVLLSNHPESLARISEVLDLVRGFESMYGLGLLSSVHWVMAHQAGADDRAVAQQVRAGNPRNGRLFTPEHVSTALAALRERELAPGLPWSCALDHRRIEGT